MARTLDALVKIAENANVGTGGTSIFAGTDVDFPNGPGPFLSLLETPGKPPVGAHNASSLRQPGIQVTARGDEYPTVAAMLELALLAYGGEQALVNIEVENVFFLTIRPSSEPFTLPNDAQGRVRIAFNLSAIRR